MPTDPYGPGRRRLAVALRPRTEEVEALVARRVVEFAAELGDVDLLEDVVDAVENPAGVHSGDVVRRAGITYRQLHYWTSKGYLTALPRVRDISGYVHVYPAVTVLKARIMGSLVEKLGMAPAPAADLADRIIRDGSATVDGFKITTRGLS